MAILIGSQIFLQHPVRTAVYTSAPASPLLPQRSTNRKVNGSGNSTLGRPRAESVNERPFVAVKRAYDFRKYNDNQVLKQI